MLSPFTLLLLYHFGYISHNYTYLFILPARNKIDFISFFLHSEFYYEAFIWQDQQIPGTPRASSFNSLILVQRLKRFAARGQSHAGRRPGSNIEPCQPSG